MEIETPKPSKLMRKFMMMESNQVPLTEVPFEEVRETIIDPTTGKPYKGMILEGVFADLSNNVPNNNGRFYDIPTYLELLQGLKKEIFSPKGLYGECEHPKRYSIDTNETTHKILDVWYEESTKKVYGRVLVFNYGGGLQIQQHIKTGGLVAISARAAGEEEDLPDGSKMCYIRLLVTYDIVYHPGFSTAVLGFKCMNESDRRLQEFGKTRKGFRTIIYEDEFDSLPNKWNEFMECTNTMYNPFCFGEWLSLDESVKAETLKSFNQINQKAKTPKQKQQDKKIQKNKSAQQDKLENRLSKSVDEELDESNESEEVFDEKNSFFQQINNQQVLIKKGLKDSGSIVVANQKSYGLKKQSKKLAKSHFDDSAGFMTMDVTDFN